MNLEPEWKPDFLRMNRIDTVRLVEQDGILYVQHRLDASKPEATYKSNALVKFANAHGPDKLLGFIAEHGYLFAVDSTQATEPSGDFTAPQVDTVKAAFAPFYWSQKKPRAVTQAAKRIQAETIRLDDPSEHFSSGLAPLEYLGDWLGARGVLLAALDLLKDPPAIRAAKPCPPISVSLANAPRYADFLNQRVKPEIATVHGKNGAETLVHGFQVEGDAFTYTPGLRGGTTVGAVIDRMVNIHIGSIEVECEHLEMHAKLDNLLQAMWWQLQEQAGRKFVVRPCENCGSLMTSTPNGNHKRACCTSCEQALKEQRLKEQKPRKTGR